jgi:large subunit ribosomal protein L12
MEYIYSAMVLHSAGKKITEEAVSSVLKAAGVTPDTARVKALTASLDGVDIAEAMKTAVAAPVAAAPAAAPAAAAAKKEEKEEEKVSEEDAAAGLGALFG